LRLGKTDYFSKIDTTTPQLIPFFKDKKIKNVVCGGEHTIVITGISFSLLNK
jgi:alpha-tubulin suppressor-like RCC1 family protein